VKSGRISAIAVAALFVAARGAVAQDPAAGEQVFQKCRPCHQIGEGARNLVGPVLNGVVGRPAGSYPGFRYSDANKNSRLVWDAPTLQVYLKNPQAKVPGTRMAFPGLLSDAEIADLIAYLAQFCADGAKR
jgi:cytochrome c